MKVALLTLALVGCHVVDESRPPPVEVPEAYTQAGGTADAADRWWEEFADPELESLVADVLADNLELRQAWARLEQAQSLDRHSVRDLAAREFDSERIVDSIITAVNKARLGGGIATAAGV